MTNSIDIIYYKIGIIYYKYGYFVATLVNNGGIIYYNPCQSGSITASIGII